MSTDEIVLTTIFLTLLITSSFIFCINTIYNCFKKKLYI